MTTFRPYQPLPPPSVPSASPNDIASSLINFAECFGITRNASFSQRCGGLAFTNAVMLGIIQPDGAVRLREILRPHAPSAETLRAAASCVADAFQDDDSWLDSIRRSLESSMATGDNSNSAADFTPRVIAALTIGLEVVESQFPLTTLIEGRARLLKYENSFLSRLLVRWCKHGFRPVAQPFIEFVHIGYSNTPVEQRVMCAEAGEAFASAHQLPDPWLLSFWVEQAWTRGHRLVASRPNVAHQLITESSERNRQYTLALFRELILRPAEATGQVDLVCATLTFFARTDDGVGAIEYCAGDQPRKTARLAFDFAFWMGIISAIPIPSAASSAMAQELDS